MTPNGSNTHNYESEKLIENTQFSDISNLVGEGARRVALIASLGLANLASETRAEEYRVADAGPTVEGTVARAFDGLPTSVEEITTQAEIQRVISDVMRRREKGMEFYSPYLDQFNALSVESQYEIALLINPENSEGGPEYPQDTIELVRNLRLPVSMIQAILDEAVSNGADADWDIPAFEEVLYELRESGATESGDTFADVVALSPENTEKIYFVYAVNSSIVARQEAERDAAISTESAAEAARDAARATESAAEAARDAARATETREILQDALNAANGD